MSLHRSRQFSLARLLGSAVGSQALLSASSFALALVLIRRSNDLQYGSYILASNAILLLVSLQNAFFGPALAIRLPRLDAAERARLVGSLYRGQQRILTALGAVAGAASWGLWWAGVLDWHSGPLALAAVAAAFGVLHREYFRMVLFAYRRAQDVLRTDLAYVALLLAGVFAATLTPAPALVAIATLGIAALAGGRWLAFALGRHEAFDRQEVPGLMAEVAPLAAWATAGAAIHWTFSQGYIYLVAGTLDVAAVAAIAATRLLLMPVNLLSTGIGSLMLPLAAGWLQRHGLAQLRRRLALFALGMALVALCYFALLWQWREDVVRLVLHKQIAQRDELLLLWGALLLVMVVRDQFNYLQAAQGRYRAMTLLTLACAVLSLLASYVGMQRLGAPGALAGMLAGELMSVTGILLMSRRRAAALAITPA